MTKCKSVDLTLCRLCLQNAGLIDIFINNLQEMILECTQIKIEDELSLPNKICEKCRQTIETFHTFLQLIKEVNKNLFDLIQNKNTRTFRTVYKCSLCARSYKKESYWKKHIETHKQIASKIKAEEDNFTSNAVIAQERDCSKKIVPEANENLGIFETKLNKNESSHQNSSLEKESVVYKVIKDDSPNKGLEDLNLNKSQIIIIVEDGKQIQAPDLTKMKVNLNDVLVENVLNLEQVEVDVNLKNIKVAESSIELEEEKIEMKKNVVKERNTVKEEVCFSCTECNTIFLSKGDLFTHKNQKHQKPSNYSLKNGEKVNTDITIIKKSKKENTRKKKSYLCTICGKSLRSRISLKSHEEAHNIIKNYACTLCKMAYSFSGSLKTHIKKVHEGKKYQCLLCPKAFLQKSTFDRHKLVHEGVKPFVCEVCAYSFYTDRELMRHQRYHQNLKPYKCEKCLKSFFESYHLTLHLRIHNGEKPFTCDFPDCEKSFYSRTKLNRHKNNVHKKM